MYLIIETADREVISVHPTIDKPAAIAKSNELLKEHCRLGGHIAEYIAAETDMKPADWPEELKLAGDSDSTDPGGAWCNLKCGCVEHWDAHIVYIADEARTKILDIALKILCKDIMAQPDSDCGDGSCDECPINSILNIIAEAFSKQDDESED